MQRNLSKTAWRTHDPSIAWVGSVTRPEHAWARTAAAAIAPLCDITAIDHAAEGREVSPTVTLLATDRPGRFAVADAVAIARRWPLTVMVSVATSLADGRRRSGPAFPGIDEVLWCDLPGRLGWWISEVRAGRPGMLGLPSTARREDRLFEAAAQVSGARLAGRPSRGIAIAARCSADLDGLAALVAAVGHDIVRCPSRRPPVDVEADLVIWDAEALDTSHLAWLRILTTHRPGLDVVLLDSFPHQETASAALAAGAMAVLSRPLALETLAGTLLAGKNMPGIGVGGLPACG
jgi:hypothetical protein